MNLSTRYLNNSKSIRFHTTSYLSFDSDIPWSFYARILSIIMY